MIRVQQATPSKLKLPSPTLKVGVRTAALTDRDIQAGLTLIKMMGLPHTRTDAMLRSKRCAEWLNVRDKAMAKELTIEDLRNHFDKPIAEAAFNFGICTTLLKKICRKLGVQRWPCRQIRSLSKTIQSYELQLEKVQHQPAESAAMRNMIQEFRNKQQAILMDPGKYGKLDLSIRRKAASGKKKVEALDRKRTLSTSSLDSCVSDPRSPDFKHMKILPVIHDHLELMVHPHSKLEENVKILEAKIQQVSTCAFRDDEEGQTDSEKSLDFTKQPDGEPSPLLEGTC